ncbi:MAG: hypothetical protein J1F16_10100 [Muribaculaceae bacterium]|nr:hypothetical protein [Muribaculaceae bacterium]
MKRSSLLFLMSLLLIATACKPTEKNYKAAYDAALGKREAALADINVNLPEGAFQQVDGPQLKTIEGSQVYFNNQHLKPVEENKTLPGNYNVVVGAYKMITNCRAQSQALRDEGFDAFPAQDTEDMFYTVAGSFSSLSEAVKFYDSYKKNKNRVYVGLPNSPVIIYSPL